jgi:putative cell wall-binding protein
MGCVYLPLNPAAYPPNTTASIGPRWAGLAHPDPDSEIFVGGCQATMIEQEGNRWYSSPTTYASVDFGVYADQNGRGMPSEPILAAHLPAFVAAAEELLAFIEPLAHRCSSLTSTVTRTAGVDRYETAALISRAWTTADTVYVATGSGFADALAAGPAAAEEDAPILLVRKDDIPTPTAAALTRLRPRTIVVLGGTAVLSESVVDALGAYADSVERVAGSDRYATAIAIIERAFPEPPSRFFVASGVEYLDALIAGAAAARAGVPLLLVDGQAPLEQSVSDYLDSLPLVDNGDFVGPSVTTVASPFRLSDAVLDALPFATDRVEDFDIDFRSARLLQLDDRGFSSVMVATTAGYADALAATPAAARANIPLVVAEPGCFGRYVLAELEARRPARITLVGGTAVLSADVAGLGVCYR